MIRKILIGVLSIIVLFTLIVVLMFSRYNISYKIHPGFAEFQRQLGIHSPSAGVVQQPPIIIGHRGIGLATKSGQGTIGNTTTAIEQGIAAGADWIEVDVHQSVDGHLIVFHDATLEEKTNGQGAVAELSLEQLQAVELDVAQGDNKIPTLASVLNNYAKQGTKFILDIKALGIRETVLKDITDANIPKDQLIIFGKHSIIREYKDSGYVLGYTVMWGAPWNKQRFLLSPHFLLKRMQALGSDARYLVLPDILLNQNLITHAIDDGYSVWTFRSDDPRDWKDNLNRGVNGLIVDDVVNAVTLFKHSKMEGK